jgi:hypothetical protein
LCWRQVRQERGAGEEQSECNEFESGHHQQVSGRARLTTIRCVRAISREDVLRFVCAA